MQQIMTIPFSGQEVCQGFNSVTRENVGTGLFSNNVGEDKVADGQDVSTSFEIITDQESLKETLGVSAELDARYMLFSGDAKMKFSDTHAVNSCSSFIAGRCLVKNALRTGHDFQLTDNAKALVASQRMDDFKTAFGDMFVRSMSTGGEFLIIARITSTSETTQHDLCASLHAEYNGGTTGVSFSAEFTKASQDTTNHTEVSVWMIQRGGVGVDAELAGTDGKLLTGLDAPAVLTHLAGFPVIAHKDPVGYEVEVANYNTIPIILPTVEEIEAREIALNDCAQQKVGFLKVIADLDLAMSDNGKFLFDGDLPSNDILAQMKGQYRTTLNDLFIHAIAVSTGRINPPQTFVANPIPPQFTFKKKISAPPTPSQIVVPSVLHLTANDAHTILEAKGLHFSDVLVAGMQGSPDNGTVIEQNPVAGTMVDGGSTITLKVPSIGIIVTHPFPL